jgi:hypothetical protein
MRREKSKLVKEKRNQNQCKNEKRTGRNGA